MHIALRTKIRETLRPGSISHAVQSPTSDSENSSDDGTPSTTSPHRKNSNEEKMASVNKTPPEIKEQVHFYTVNSLLRHPLVSPALSYLGDLPPLLFIAGDKEVLRDEVIYTFVSIILYEQRAYAIPERIARHTLKSSRSRTMFESSIPSSKTWTHLHTNLHLFIFKFTTVCFFLVYPSCSSKID